MRIVVIKTKASLHRTHPQATTNLQAIQRAPSPHLQQHRLRRQCRRRATKTKLVKRESALRKAMITNRNSRIYSVRNEIGGRGKGTRELITLTSQSNEPITPLSPTTSLIRWTRMSKDAVNL